MREERSRRGIEAARAGLPLILTLFLVACEKEPAVESNAPAAPAAVVSKKVEPPADAAKDRADAARAAANAALAAKVKAGLAAEPALKGTGIDVVATDGSVSLFGTVKSARQIATAGKVASRIPGVTSVTNKLVVLAGS